MITPGAPASFRILTAPAITTGVDHVVDQHADTAFDFTDHGLGFGLIRLAEVRFVNER